MLFKHKFLFCFLNLAFLVVFYFIIPGFCFATELNVNYPVLSTGAGINFQTPIQEYLKYIFD
ncbi:MAG: hypothetical protein Q7K54_01465, partial [Candidatus Parcubacteria bacterium]|nr:hypothetical protein [Candidatus Parcubacteria bacterium]